MGDTPWSCRSKDDAFADPTTETRLPERQHNQQQEETFRLAAPDGARLAPADPCRNRGISFAVV